MKLIKEVVANVSGNAIFNYEYGFALSFGRWNFQTSPAYLNNRI